MNRIGKNLYYLGIARSVAERSTCLRRRYGAVIVNHDEIVSTGYNGAPRGEDNCCDTGLCRREALQIPKGERYELCLAGNTRVSATGNLSIAIEELATQGPSSFLVWAMDLQAGKPTLAYGHLPRETGFEDVLREIAFTGGSAIQCTEDHLFLVSDGTYRRAKALRPGDQVAGMRFGVNGKRIPCPVAVEYVGYLIHHGPVYDLTVPKLENFAVSLDNGTSVFVHNCVSVHAEQNAIISASRKEMLGGTIYITGLEKDGSYANPAPCIMCRRFIRNAGIVRCVGMVDGQPQEIPLTPPDGAGKG